MRVPLPREVRETDTFKRDLERLRALDRRYLGAVNALTWKLARRPRPEGAPIGLAGIYVERASPVGLAPILLVYSVNADATVITLGSLNVVVDDGGL